MHPAPASVTSDRQPRLEFPNNHRNARVQQIRASPPIAATVPPSNQVHNPLFRCPFRRIVLSIRVSILGPDSSFLSLDTLPELSSGTDPATAMQSGSFPFTAKLSMGLSVKVDSSNMLTLLFDSASFSGSILDPSNGNWLTIGPTFSFTGDAYGVQVPQGVSLFYLPVSFIGLLTNLSISPILLSLLLLTSCTTASTKKRYISQPKDFSNHLQLDS
ncbi:hypothetical protein BASA83_009112 [Batrachochytrium salamandrivorans]|nr:hypothetical protein BASA83_009112 [Batrachochytrium salamandrivorans]